MKTKKYLLRLVVGLLALALGIGVYYFFVYLATTTDDDQDDKQYCKSESTFVEESEVSKSSTTTPLTFDVKTEDELARIEPFYPDGNYYLIGDTPKAFNDFDSLSIESVDWTNVTGDVPPTMILPKGFVTIDKKSKFIELKFKKISINNRLISFVTEEVKGVSYKFIGKFLEDISPAANADEPVSLDGKLTKMNNGKKVIEINAQFGYVHEC